LVPGFLPTSFKTRLQDVSQAPPSGLGGQLLP